MTEETLACLEELAATVSTADRHVSSMQVAAQLLEEVVREYSREAAA